MRSGPGIIRKIEVATSLALIGYAWFSYSWMHALATAWILGIFIFFVALFLEIIKGEF